MRRVIRLAAIPALSAVAVLGMSLCGCTALDQADSAFNQALGLQPTPAQAPAYWDEQAREYTAYMQSAGYSAQSMANLIDYARRNSIPASVGIPALQADDTDERADRQATLRRKLNDWLARAYNTCANAAFDHHDGSPTWYDKCANQAEDRYHAAEAKGGLPYQSTGSIAPAAAGNDDLVGLLMGMMPDGPPMPGVPYGAPQ